MRNRLLIASFLLAAQTQAQSRLSIGQYAYLHTQQPLYLSPIVQYQGPRNWYAEARYNYEEQHTFSLYGGRTFSADTTPGHRFSYTITPMAGIMEGSLHGGSAGLNAELDYKGIYFSTQSQYSFSWREDSKNFFFSWSEIGYRPLKWLFAGVSVQQTKSYRARAVTEPGLFVCFAFRQWSFPLYAFRPAQGPAYFVAGIIHEWKYPGSSRTKTTKPPFRESSRALGY